MDINEILKYVVSKNASDLHLKVGNKPIIRVNKKLIPINNYPIISPDMLRKIGYSLMNKFQKDYFDRTHDLDMAYGVPGLGRFRVNLFQQRGSMGIVFRIIPGYVKSLKELNLPEVLNKIAKEERGLILVTGTTGSGKSTTLASIIDRINEKESKNIITIEDPIEFLIKDKNSIVNQRELGVDTISFSKAIKAALRQDPDVILVGEMRDFETIETALTAAETGHLVLSTLHTVDASETINRIISVFPPHQQKQTRLQLASIIKAIISQRLVPTSDGSMTPAVEILISTSRIKEMISDPIKSLNLVDAIEEGHNSYGMQTFDQALMRLVSSKKISYNEALKHSSNPDDFALKFRGVAGSSNKEWKDFESNGLDYNTNYEKDKVDDLIEDVEMIYELKAEDVVPKKEEKSIKKKKFDFSSMDNLF